MFPSMSSARWVSVMSLVVDLASITGRGSVPPAVAGVDFHAHGGTHHGEPDGDDHQESGGEVVVHRVVC